MAYVAIQEGYRLLITADTTHGSKNNCWVSTYNNDNDIIMIIHLYSACPQVSELRGATKLMKPGTAKGL